MLVECRGLVAMARQRSNAEVHQLYTGRRQHDIRRFQVPVNDPGLVDRSNSLGELHPVSETVVDRENAALETLRERFACQVLHHQKWKPGVAVDIEELVYRCEGD